METLENVGGHLGGQQPLETSLVEWKRGSLDGIIESGVPLGNFLSGMETPNTIMNWVRSGEPWKLP